MVLGAGHLLGGPGQGRGGAANCPGARGRTGGDHQGKLRPRGCGRAGTCRAPAAGSKGGPPSSASAGASAGQRLGGGAEDSKVKGEGLARGAQAGAAGSAPAPPTPRVPALPHRRACPLAGSAGGRPNAAEPVNPLRLSPGQVACLRGPHAASGARGPRRSGRGRAGADRRPEVPAVRAQIGQPWLPSLPSYELCDLGQPASPR